MTADPGRTRRPPTHLRPSTRRWWRSVVETWALEEHHVLLLTATAQAWDTLQAAEARLRDDGLTVETKAGGPRAHPAVKIAMEARTAFFRGVRELDLDVTPPQEARSRPPSLRSVSR